MERKLQLTRSVERKLLTLDEHQYNELENLLNGLLIDPKLLEDSKKLEPDKDGNLLYTRLVNVRLLDSDLYIVFAVHDSVLRVIDIIHKATVDYFKKQLAN